MIVEALLENSENRSSFQLRHPWEVLVYAKHKWAKRKVKPTSINTIPYFARYDHSSKSFA